MTLKWSKSICMSLWQYESGGFEMNTEVDYRKQDVQQALQNACDSLNDAGVNTRDYVEQLAWFFPLKAFDETEQQREEEAAFDDTSCERPLTSKFAWSSWSKLKVDEMHKFAQGEGWTKLTGSDSKEGLGDDADV